MNALECRACAHTEYNKIMHIFTHCAQALATKSGTMTPLWVGMWVMLKYRTRNNYRSPVYLVGRLFDKTIFAFLICTFYLWIGRNDTSGNEPNIAGLFFLW
jgi:hypothetical protein